MKNPSKDFENLYSCDHAMKNPSTNFNKFSKLMISFILLFFLTYFIYYLHFILYSPSFSLSNQSPIISLLHQLQPSYNSPPKIQPLEDQKTNLSHIVFGIASSAELWNRRKNYIKIWWRPDQMRGAAWLDKKLIKTSIHDHDKHMLPPIKISSNASKLFKYKNRNVNKAIRISMIASESFKLGFDNVRWFVMCDDDTVFIPENLVRVLSKYDHTQFYYIGSSSESHLANINFSYDMAFGGGGFAISYPLARALSKIQDNCIRRYPYLLFSDSRIHACMAELGVPLTKEPGFHQFDVYGNLLGLLSAHPLQPFVSLHHLDVVDPIFPNMDRFKALQKLRIPAKLDSAGLMQQSICYDKANSWTVSVAWGYTVQIIRGKIPAQEMEMPARTFLNWFKKLDYKWFSFNTRPTSRNKCQKPLFYYLTNAVLNATRNQTTSEYVKQQRVRDPKCKWNMADPSKILRIEVYKTPDPYVWDKAPRRNCCKVMPGKKKGTMVIDVGPCREDEIIN